MQVSPCLLRPASILSFLPSSRVRSTVSGRIAAPAPQDMAIRVRFRHGQRGVELKRREAETSGMDWRFNMEGCGFSGTALRARRGGASLGG